MVRDDGTNKYKKFNPDNKNYVAATAIHKKILKKISRCFPYYTQAREVYMKMQRLTPTGKNFDAAGHIPLCMIVMPEVNTWSRGRLMLVAFMQDYKPSTDLERALFDKCKDALEVADKQKQSEFELPKDP